MDWKSLSGLSQMDSDYPLRTWNLMRLGTVLDGTQYDALEYDFHTEHNGAGEYVSISKRRPSVRTNLCRVVIDDAVGLLFSEGHFPALTGDKPTIDSLEALIKETKLNEVMIDAATRGSVGSICILMRVLSKRIFWSVMPTQYLTPKYDPNEPDTLISVKERYKVPAADLIAAGYSVKPEDGEHWFQRIWDEQAETWYLPQKRFDASAGKSPVIDTARTVKHALGFVPMVWIKNLPGGDDTEGDCTFRAGLDTVIEIDYQLSQAGRGLKYSSDPTLLIKEPATEGSKVLGGGNAIVVDEKGDAKMLEINGTASAAVIDYVRFLRQAMLEATHGNRTDSEKFSAAQSGRALELMNQGLVWLADKLRISYGEGGLLALLRMICAAAKKYPLTVQGKATPALNATDLALRWPDWYAPTWDDKVQQANAVQTLINASVMSLETGTGTIADTYDIEDVPAELAKIKGDLELQQQRALELKPPPLPGNDL